MSRMKLRSVCLVALFGLSATPLALVACSEDSRLEEAVEEAGDEIEDAADEVKDEIDDAT
jgi:hypothetical protein